MSYAIVAHTSFTMPGTGGTSGSINTTGADLIVIAVSGQAGSAPTFSDSKSNAWTSIALNPATARHGTWMGYSLPSSVGSAHTFTIGVAGFGSVSIVSVSGSRFKASVLDALKSATDAAGFTTLATGVITPTHPDELFVAQWGIDDPTDTGGTPFSVDSGFTIVEQNDVVPGATYGGVMAYLIQPGQSAVNPTLTRSVAGNNGGDTALIASFRSSGFDVDSRFVKNVTTRPAPFRPGLAR